MYQPTFASVEFEQKRRKTRREVFRGIEAAPAGVAAGEDGAPLPDGEAALRLRGGEVPGLGQEPGADDALAGADEPARGSPQLACRETRTPIRSPEPNRTASRGGGAAAPDTLA